MSWYISTRVPCDGLLLLRTTPAAPATADMKTEVKAGKEEKKTHKKAAKEAKKDAKTEVKAEAVKAEKAAPEAK